MYISLLSRHPELEAIIEDPLTLLMFPGPRAVDLTDFIENLRSDTNCGGYECSEARPFNLILLDGTWDQAKGLYHKNKFLHGLKQVSSLAFENVSQKLMSVKILLHVPCLAYQWLFLKDCQNV